MANFPPVPLDAVSVGLGGPIYAAISAWPYADAFVGRLLGDDLPRRVRLGSCRVWAYREPSGQLAGFGSLDTCADYGWITGGTPHLYISLLAVNPTIKSMGYGTTIVRHLLTEAEKSARDGDVPSPVVYLDVYTASEKTIGLYAKWGFEPVTGPLADDLAGGLAYVVMARGLGPEPP